MRKLRFSIGFLIVFLIVFVSLGIAAGSKEGDLGKGLVSAIKVEQMVKIAHIPSEKSPQVVWAKDGQKFAYISRGEGNYKNWARLWVSTRDGKAKKLIFSSPQIWAPQWSPVGDKISFSTSNGIDNYTVIYNNEEQKIEGTISGTWATWSPDGKKIAYCKYPRGKARSDQIEIFVSGVDGSGRRFLTNGSDPIWSPRGDQIAFRTAEQEIPSGRWTTCLWLINPDGSNKRLLNTPGGAHPLWSPDGLHICYSSDGCLGVVHIASDSVFSIEGSDIIDTYSWSPDGTRIAFSQIEFFEGEIAHGITVTKGDGVIKNSDIWIADSDGSNPLRLTDTPNVREENPAWISPDEIAVTVVDTLLILKLNSR